MAYIEVIRARYDDLDYDLEPSASDRETYRLAAIGGESGRIEPYALKAKEVLGGVEPAVRVAMQWLGPITSQIKAAPTAERRREIFKQVIEKTKRCDAMLDAWGAPKPQSTP